MIKLEEKYPVTCHTDFIKDGSIFVAIKGAKLNGLSFVKDAVERGAIEIVVEKTELIPEGFLSFLSDKNIKLTVVENSRKSLSNLSAKAVENCSDKLKIIAVTGTKGKTTSVYILESLLKSLGYKVARLSTIKNSIDGIEFDSTLTTAQPDYLHQFFKICVENNIEYVVMEVAAQALSLHRVDDIKFCSMIFTNFESEHLEFYENEDDYFNAKCKLINFLQENCPMICNRNIFKVPTLYNKESCFSSFSYNNQDSDYLLNYKEIENNRYFLSLTDFNKNSFEFEYPNFPGIFNAYNLSGVLILLNKLGISFQSLKNACRFLEKVPGRLETYQLKNGAQAIIDYAHTPNSYESVLTLVRSWTVNLIVVFGAGGDRDKTKRPLMGKIASQIADKIILTSDNPRSEKAEDIINDIENGIDLENKFKVLIELDRKKAIELAYSISSKNSIIILFGKGPDQYQIFGKEKTYFSEKEIILYLK